MYASAVKATLIQFGNSFSSLTLNVSSKLEANVVPTAQAIKSERRQKSSAREQLPTTCRKHCERKRGPVNTLNVQALASSNDKFENGYTAKLVNRCLSNNRYGALLLKCSLLHSKTVPAQTPPDEESQKLGLAEARSENATKNDPHSISRGPSRTNEEQVELSVESYNALEKRLKTADRPNVFSESSGPLRKVKCE